jgi:predicted permease
MQTILQDIRYALRQLLKSPGFTLVAVLTLALGIGANTAIYSIIHGALRLPFPNAERMVAIENVYPTGSYFAVSYPDLISWRASNKSFSKLAARSYGTATWDGSWSGSSSSQSAGPQSLNTGAVTEDFFPLFGVQPVLGRSFLPSEHQKGAAPVCALVEDFWRDKLNADPGVIGRSMNLDGKPCTIVGVLPVMLPSRSVDVWTPLEPNPPYIEHGTNYLSAVGLRKPGVSVEAAQSELATLQAQIDKQFPDNKHGVALKPLSQALFGDLRALMFVLMAAVGFILLIACVNLANMLLARAADRAKEFAIRRALGASPRRMLQQALTESLLLSLAGAVAGLAFAELLTHIPLAAWPKGFVRPSDVHLDASILVFTAALAILTGVLFGIIPALRILGSDERQTLQQGRTVTESRDQNRTRSLLVISEIALSMLLVAGSLNMALYFLRLLDVDPGVNPHHAFAMTLSLSPKQYSAPDERWRFYSSLLDRLSALPGVSAAGAGMDTPFTGSESNGDFEYEGQPTGTADHKPFMELHVVTPGYFAAVQTPILQGRDFTRQDQPGSQEVIIINRLMAQKLWPGQSALGKHIKHDDKWAEIVGIAADVHFAGPAEPTGFQSYSSAQQVPPRQLTFVLRTSGDPLALAQSARHAVTSIDPGQPISDITSLDVLARQSIAGQRTSAMVTAILGGLALLLASIGVYGVMAYSVSRREREFGIRMALGADRQNILKLLFSGVFRLVLVGVIVGAAATYAMRAWTAALLGGSGTSSLALVGAALLLCAVAALATYLPARRAMQVQPMQALRSE